MDDLTKTQFRRSLVAASVMFLVGCWALFLSYRPYEIDSPWFLSFTYGWRHGVPNDQFMSIRFPSGQDGTILFGKIAAFMQSIPGELFHWQQVPFAIFHSFLVLAALGCWAYALRRSGCSYRSVLSIFIAFAISEPVVSATQRFRYEAEGFFLTSVGLLLAAADLPFPGMLIAMIAVETQPIALLGVLPVLFLCWWRRKGSILTFVTHVALATVVAAGVYLLLHPHTPQLLMAMRTLNQQQTRSERSAGLLVYFAKDRHIVEAVLFSIIPVWVAVAWLRRRVWAIPRGASWLAPSAALTLLIGYFIKHSNPAYILYAYCLLIALLVLLWDKRAWQWGVAVGFCLLFVPQYLWLAKLNWGQGYRPQDIAMVQRDLQQAAHEIGEPVDELKLIADYSLWYSHPRNFHANTPANGPFFASSDLLLCYDSALPGVSTPTLLHCHDYLSMYPNLKLLRTDRVRGNLLYLYRINVDDRTSALH